MNFTEAKMMFQSLNDLKYPHVHLNSKIRIQQSTFTLEFQKKEFKVEFQKSINKFLNEFLLMIFLRLLKI